MVSDLPREIDMFDETFVIDQNQPVFGIIDGNPEIMAEYGALPLDKALVLKGHSSVCCWSEGIFAPAQTKPVGGAD